MRKKIEKINLTPELKEHYKCVGEFLKEHPEIQSKKLVVGYQVDVSTIPDELVDEWIEVANYYKT
jgi:hypothetical protein